MMLLLFTFVLIEIVLIWFKQRKPALVGFFICLGAGTGLLLRLMTTSLGLNY